MLRRVIDSRTSADSILTVRITLLLLNSYQLVHNGSQSSALRGQRLRFGPSRPQVVFVLGPPLTKGRFKCLLASASFDNSIGLMEKSLWDLDDCSPPPRPGLPCSGSCSASLWLLNTWGVRTAGVDDALEPADDKAGRVIDDAVANGWGEVRRDAPTGEKEATTRPVTQP
jgi:hypothetical protein